LPDDTFWAAKKVMSFTDEQLRALVETGEYSDPAAAEYLVRVLAERRDKIGRVYFSRVLPLDNFRIEGGRLHWDDLAAIYGFDQARAPAVAWSTFDNQTGAKGPIANATDFTVPKSGARFLAADLRGATAAKTATVYLRSRGGSYEVVGIERRW
jgi:hypothetical protein